MNYLDIIILVPMAWFVYKGLKNGLIIEVTSLLALFLGIFAGIYLSSYVSGLLVKHLGFNPNYTSAIAYVIIFIGVLILMRMIAKAMEKALDLTALGFVNKLLGALFATLKILFLISLLFYMVNMFDKRELIITPAAKNKSLLYKPVSAIAPLTIPIIKAEYQKLQTKDTIVSKVNAK